MNNRKFSSPAVGAIHSLAAALAVTLLAATPQQARSSEFGALPAAGVPVPMPRPPYSTEAIPFMATSRPVAASVSAIDQNLTQPSSQPASQPAGAAREIEPISGNLKAGLDALSAKDAGKALAIRAGMRPGSLERKILAWSIALSGQSGIASAEIAKIAVELRDWPGQQAMRINSEKALAAEKPDARTVINAFGTTRPESLNGAILLAKAYLAAGNRKAANSVIGAIWREQKLDDAEEKRILAELGEVLTRDDHRVRMAMLLYRERVSAALRVAGLAGQSSLAKAWAAVIRNDAKAVSLLDAVPAAQKKDPGYLFARLKYHRRAGNYQKAAKLLLAAPRDKAALIVPDEWWVEGRIISRALIDEGDARTAYRIAANHSAESAAAQAEAEFHAGWFALRFLKDSRRAAAHFERIVKISSTPISQARGHYWLGRALGGAAGAQHLRAAAQHGGTYYGQLAAQALGEKKLRVSNPRPNSTERNRFTTYELVQAIVALEDAGYDWRAGIIYRELAERINSPGELALLAVRAERRGNHTLALQVGKIAHGRGLEVDTVSWPIGAIPSKANIGNTGRALAYAIARQESAFNVGAVSPANAKGLLQLLPGTAKMMARKTGLEYSSRRLVTDAAYNATLGAAYLSEQLDNFGNSYILTFAGYNAGPGRVKEWLATYGDPRGKPLEEVVDWVERIPFTETRNYVQRVMENYQVYKARISDVQLDIEGDLRFGRR